MVKMMNKGFSLIELLISATISMVILAMFVQQISFSSKAHLDNSVMQRAHNEAQSVINMLGIDFRMIGNGIPFEVSNFDIGDELENHWSFSFTPDVTYPILVGNTGDTRINYLLN